MTALLEPQVDIASPVMERAGGTYGEDPQLTLDIATAYVNAMQSTYDENGEDLDGETNPYTVSLNTLAVQALPKVDATTTQTADVTRYSWEITWKPT